MALHYSEQCPGSGEVLATAPHHPAELPGSRSESLFIGSDIIHFHQVLFHFGPTQTMKHSGAFHLLREPQTRQTLKLWYPPLWATTGVQVSQAIR